MHYIVYQTTNTQNGMVYIGAHATTDINDGYLGSGGELNRDIKRLGTSSFVKELLFVFDEPGPMHAKEAELVTREFCLREDTYNQALGGKTPRTVQLGPTAKSPSSRRAPGLKPLVRFPRMSEETWAEMQAMADAQGLSVGAWLVSQVDEARRAREWALALQTPNPSEFVRVSANPRSAIPMEPKVEERQVPAPKVQTKNGKAHPYASLVSSGPVAPTVTEEVRPRTSNLDELLKDLL